VDLSTIQKITVYALPLIFAITLHEAAHAYAAKRLGDLTAFSLGRVTLNPAKHIDPLWTIVIPIVTLIFSPFVFGAAKPVPVNFSALKNPRRDMVLVAAAGPAANLVMMIGWGLVGKIALAAPGSLPIQYVLLVAEAGIVVNALLMVFNLFPLLPLDGGRIVAGLLPPRLALPYARLEPYGMFILIGLILTGVLSAFLVPLVGFSVKAVYFALGFA
jgi:Zn-dependent protease